MELGFNQLSIEIPSIQGVFFMKVIRFIMLLLIVVGALNWGLWGFFQYDLIADLFGGNTSSLARILYIAVGIAGIYGISFFFVPEIYGCKSNSGPCNKE